MRRYFPALTGLRAVAAYMVFFHHLEDRTAPLGYYLNKFGDGFHIGVNIFFVLSGFVITMGYYHQARPSLEWFTGYLRKRFARIYPLYFLVFGARYLLRRPEEWWDRFRLFLNLSLVKGFCDTCKTDGVVQAWTLNVEECFYFTAPLLFFWLRERRNLALLVIGVYLSGLALVPLEIKVHGFGFFDTAKFITIYSFFGAFFQFCCGAYLAVCMLEARPILCERMTRRWNRTYAGVAGIFGVLVANMYFEITRQNVPFHVYENFQPWDVLTRLVLPPFVALLIWGLVTERTLISRFLSTRMLQALGRSSYALYLLHAGAIADLIERELELGVVGLVLAMTAVAHLAYLLIEEPLRKLLAGSTKPAIQGDARVIPLRRSPSPRRRRAQHRAKSRA